MSISGVCTFTNERFHLALAASRKDDISEVVVAPIPLEATAIDKRAVWKITRQYDLFSSAVLKNSFSIDSDFFDGHSLTQDDQGKLKIETSSSRKIFWKIIKNSDGFYFLRNRRTNLYLRAMGENELAFNNDGSTSHQWEIKALGGGSYAFLNRKYGKFLSTNEDNKVRMIETGIPRKFLWDVEKNGEKCVIRSLLFREYYVEIPHGNMEKIGLFNFPNSWGQEHNIWRVIFHGDLSITLINQSEKNPLDKDATLVVPYEPNATPPINPLIKKRTYDNLTWKKYSNNDYPQEAKWRVCQIFPSQGFTLDRIEKIKDLSTGFQNGPIHSVLRKEDVHVDGSRLPILRMATNHHSHRPTHDGLVIRNTNGLHVYYAYTKIERTTVNKGVDVPSAGMHSGLNSQVHENNRLIAQVRLDSEGLRRDTEQMIEALRVDQFFAMEAARQQTESAIKATREQLVEIVLDALTPRIHAAVESSMSSMRQEMAALQEQVDRLKTHHEE